MNKAFKVLWNDARRSFVVSSETQRFHGKPKKFTKTLLATALAGLMAVGTTASAETVLDSDYFYGEGSTATTMKFIDGDGEGLIIKTDASAGKLLEDLKAALAADDLTGKLQGILKAISQQDSESQTAIPAFSAGGSNFMDFSTQEVIDFAGPLLGLNVEGKLSDVDIPDETVSAPKYELSGDTFVQFGDEEGTSDPVTIFTTGGDRVINTGSKGTVMFGSAGSGTSQTFEVTRDGNTNTISHSGDILGFVGGSSAVNVGAIDVHYGHPLEGFGNLQTLATDTTVILNGSANTSLLGTTSSIGAMMGGSAIALGGNATSKVLQGVDVHIDTAVDSTQLNGYHVGLLGAGVSVATSKGHSLTQVDGGVTIQVDQGMVLGAFGAGVAMSSDLSGFLPQDLGDKKPWVWGTNLDGGDSKIVVNDGVHISFNGTSSAFAVMGGGAAIASSSYVTDSLQPREGANTSTSNVQVNGDIVLDIGDEYSPILAGEDRGEFHGLAAQMIMDLRDLNLSKISVGKIQEYTEALSEKGVHAAILGGGMAVANGAHQMDTVTAESMVGNTFINLKGGYNIGTLAGGISVAKVSVLDDEFGDQLGQTSAKTSATQTFVHITGGENLLVAGGGASYATARNGYESTVIAESLVDTAFMQVDRGIVDGLYGGGIAIDDTNANAVNAKANTNNIYITVNDGEVNEANVAPIVSNIVGDITDSGAPTNGTYVNDTADLIDAANVAILGGGMATGGGAQAITSGESKIVLNGGTISGSVFGGGAATLGGTARVKNSLISVNGATVNGNIYGGGLAGSPRNDETSSSYQNSVSHVENSTIKILSGTVNGDIYASGFVYKGNTGPTASVKTSTIILGSNDALVKEKALIDGTNTETSTLQFVQDSFDMINKSVVGFDTIEGYAQSVINIDYEFGDKDSTSVTGNVGFASVTAETDKSMTVGTDDAMGAVSIKAIEGNNANLGLGVANGVLALNADSTEDAVVAYQGATVKNAVYVSGVMGSDWLKGSTITVGSFADATGEGIFVGSDGALIADADGDTNVSNITFADGSKIHFSDVAQAAAGDKTVTVSDDASNTSVDNVLYKATVEQRDQQYIYSFNSRTGSELDEVGLGDVDDTGALGDISTQDDGASDYINDFLDPTTGGVNNGNRSQQINAALNLAAAAGVQTVAIDSATMGIDAASQRASLIHDFAEGGVLFAEASGKRFETGGSSDFGAIKADLGGLVVGGEYSANDWTFGALANLGTGTVRGQDDNSGIRNEVDYYGVQAYAGKRFGMMNVIGQVGYVTTSNDVSHTTVANEKADIDADVLSVGVRGEMRFDLTQNSRLVPYIGFNYLRVNTDGYNTDQGLRVKEQDQDVFTVPVGVKFAGDMQTASGWVMTPSMDIGYVHAFGDRDTEARTQVGATTTHTTMDVWAESVVRTSFGLKAQKDNWGVGVQAGTALGSDDTKELFGQVRVDYRF